MENTHREVVQKKHQTHPVPAAGELFPLILKTGNRSGLINAGMVGVKQFAGNTWSEPEYTARALSANPFTSCSRVSRVLHLKIVERFKLKVQVKWRCILEVKNPTLAQVKIKIIDFTLKNIPLKPWLVIFARYIIG